MRGIANKVFPVTYPYGKPSLKFANKIHNAVDYGTPSGTILFPKFDSNITKIGRDRFGSRYIQFASNDLLIEYWHIAKTLQPVGKLVRESTAIAVSGSSGAQNQPHTHVTAFRNGAVFDVRLLDVPPKQTAGNAYIVVSGDTLSAIAVRHKMSLSRLLDLNPKYRANPSLIHVGDSVMVSALLTPSFYVVKAGDNLTSIASRNNQTLNRILTNNPALKSNPNLIYPGQRIKL